MVPSILILTLVWIRGGEISTPNFNNWELQRLRDAEPISAFEGRTPVKVRDEMLPSQFFKNLQAGQRQTVVIYGTSLSHSAEWPKALNAYFGVQFPGQVICINSAQSGQHSTWGLANLEEKVLAYNPDLVFLEFSINDSATKHGISTEQSAANLDSMVQALRRQNPRVEIVLQTMNPCWNSPGEPMGKKSASDRPGLEHYYEVYREYARRNRLPLVDHYPNWVQLWLQDEAKFKEWLWDGTHPIPEASVAVTLAAILAMLEKASVAARNESATHST